MLVSYLTSTTSPLSYFAKLELKLSAQFKFKAGQLEEREGRGNRGSEREAKSKATIKGARAIGGAGVKGDGRRREANEIR